MFICHAIPANHLIYDAAQRNNMADCLESYQPSGVAMHFNLTLILTRGLQSNLFCRISQDLGLLIGSPSRLFPPTSLIVSVPIDAMSLIYHIWPPDMLNVSIKCLINQKLHQQQQQRHVDLLPFSDMSIRLANSICLTNSLSLKIELN